MVAGQLRTNIAFCTGEDIMYLYELAKPPSLLRTMTNPDPCNIQIWREFDVKWTVAVRKTGVA